MYKLFKLNIFFICFLLLFMHTNAGDVEKEKAYKVAKNFLNRETKLNSIDFAKKYILIKEKNEEVMHVFSGNHSFIIVAADKSVYPILAYSDESSFPENGTVNDFDWWLEGYSKAIYNQIKSKSEIDYKVTRAWNFYENNVKSSSLFSNTNSIAPLLHTYWNQDGGYNYYCPEHTMGPDGKCYAGCVATAMAQILKYYDYPLHGRSIHTYHHQAFGDLTVDFSKRIYDWQHMGLTTSATDLDTIKRNAIAQLIYDCGISVDMYYTPSASSSFLYKAQTSLYDYFKVKRYISYAEKADYNDDVWRNIMIENLDMKYPILYGGQDASVGGHAFVCDGYQNDNFFHFNWGWSGIGNGYFYLNNMNSGNGNFKYEQDMVYNIVPDSSVYPLCIPQKKYTSQTFTFTDGSFTDPYQNNTNCEWLIKPDSGNFIKLDFLNFNTEQGNDILTVYDGETTSSPVLGSFSGQTIPQSLYSTSGSILLVFITNSSITDLGWKVKYSAQYVGIDENDVISNLSVYPNPSNGNITINGTIQNEGTVKCKITNSIGSSIMNFEIYKPGQTFSENINVGILKPGIYFLTVESDNYKTYKKLIIR